MNPLFSPPAITDDIILIDGITRAGKMLTAKLLGGFERIEFFQYQPVLEHIPILWRLGVLDDANAATYWRLNANMVVLDRAAGRNLNLRDNDSSNIGNAPDADRYHARARDPDFDGLLEKFVSERRIPAFLTHETLPHAGLIFAAAPKAKIVEVERNLVDLAYSWFRRGWGERFGADAKALVPVVSDNGHPAPWFALDFARTFGQSYAAMSPADRCVASVLTLHRRARAALESLPVHQARQVHVMSYEKLLKDPWDVLRNVASFLDVPMLAEMKAILRREGLIEAGTPRAQNSHRELEKAVTPHLMRDLEAAAAEPVSPAPR